MMLGDVRIDDLTANGLNPAKRSPLVLAHQSAIANDVPDEDGCEPAMHSRSLRSRQRGRWRFRTATVQSHRYCSALKHGGWGKLDIP